MGSYPNLGNRKFVLSNEWEEFKNCSKICVGQIIGMWNLQRKKSEYRAVKPSKGFYLPPGITSALLTFCVLYFAANPQTQVFQAPSLTSGRQWQDLPFRTETIVHHAHVVWLCSPTSSDRGCVHTCNKIWDWNGPYETLKFSAYQVSHLPGAT